MLKNTLPGIGSVVEVKLIFAAEVVPLIEVVDVVKVEVVTVVEVDVEFKSEIEKIISVVICLCHQNLSRIPI